jgi:hypothetical protein
LREREREREINSRILKRIAKEYVEDETENGERLLAEEFHDLRVPTSVIDGLDKQLR